MLKKIKTLSLLLLSIILVCFFVGCKSEPKQVSQPPQQPVEKKTYMVAFDVQGYGNSISPFTVEEGSCINKPSNPVSDIMDFVGWYKESDCINLWNFETDKVISSTILYAKWIAKSFMYTLHPNNSDPDITGTYAYGMGFTLPTNIVKASMYFGGWYNNSSFSGDSVTEISASDFGNKEFWLKWNGNPTLKWVLNGGTVTTDGYPVMYDTEVEIEPSTTITAPVVEKKGYVFSGWNPTVPAVMPTSNVTYETQWTAKEYTVVLDKNGGDTNGSVKYTYDASTKTDFTAPTRADWTLLGLYAENTCATKVAKADGSLLANITGYTDSNGNWIKDDATVTLYAKWTSNSTVVTLNKNGGDADGSITYFYNSSGKSALSLPTRTGYSVTGFYAESGCITKIANADGTLIPNMTGYTDANGLWINGGEHVILYASWTLKTLTISLDKNGGDSDGSVKYIYNTSTKIDFIAPAKANWILVGLYAEEEGITRVASKNGTLVSGVAGYTDASGNWINDSSSTTLYAKWSDEKVFTISSLGEMVVFTSGNLQATYDGLNYTWGFAEHQWDYIGNATGNTTIDDQTSGSIVDLFGWSTPATNYGITASTDMDTCSGNFKDWGANFDNAYGYRTLAASEWEYVLNSRSASNVGGKADARYAKIKVNDGTADTCGLLIFPDIFAWNTGTMGMVPSDVNSGNVIWENTPTYSLSETDAILDAGCVFLPAAGRRHGSEVSYVAGVDTWGIYGYYYSSTRYNYNGYDAYSMFFNGGSIVPGFSVEEGRVVPSYCYGRYLGCSVRLVRDIK